MTNIPSVSTYYFAMFDLMRIFGSKYRSVLDMPQSNKAFKSESCVKPGMPAVQDTGLVNTAARVRPTGILAELILMQDQTRFQYVLNNFFVNVFEHFLPPLKLLLLLVQLLLTSRHLNCSSSEIKALKLKSESRVRSRIFVILITWISKKENDFLLGDPALFEIISSFEKYLKTSSTIRLVESHHIASVVQLVAYLKGKMKVIHKFQQQSPLALEHSPKQGHRSKQLGVIKTSKMAMLKSLLRSASVDFLSHVLMLIDIQYYLKFSLYEVFVKRMQRLATSQAGSCPQGDVLKQFLDRFNWIIRLFIFMVLTEDSSHDRAKMLQKYAQVMIALKDQEKMVDLEALYVMAQVFNHVCIKNLPQTAAVLRLHLTDEEQYVVNSCSEIDIKDDHYHNLLLAKKSTSVPVLPSTSIFLQMMAKQNVRKPTLEHDKTVNLHKMAFMNDSINLFFEAKRSEALVDFARIYSHLQQSELFRFMDTAFIRPLARELGSTSVAAERSLFNLSERSS